MKYAMCVIEKCIFLPKYKTFGIFSLFQTDTDTLRLFKNYKTVFDDLKVGFNLHDSQR